MQSSHDLVHRDLRGDAGDQGGNGEQVADQLVAGKLEPVQHISQHGADHKMLPTSTQIRIIKLFRERLTHVGLVPCDDEVIEVQKVLGQGDDVGAGILFLRLKGGEDTGHDGHQCHESGKDQQHILADIDEDALHFGCTVFFFPRVTDIRTLRSERPCRSLTHGSFISIGTSAGVGDTILCPLSSAMR